MFKKDVTDFNAAQGGIFQARFDTELLGDKSTLGAEPLEQVCYLRHRDCVPNQAARLIAPRLRAESTPLRRPFTQEWYGLHAQPALG